MVRWFGILFAGILAAVPTLADEHYLLHSTWVEPATYIKITALLLVVLATYILTIGKGMTKSYPKVFFLMMTIPVALSTLYLGGHTVFENVISETGGPVHWHADFQVWTCGHELDLINPRGLNNKIGTPLFHEHDDNRMHVEGTLLYIKDVRLGQFFTVIGGELTPDTLIYPTNDGVEEFHTGDPCNGVASELKVYVNGHSQPDFSNYVLSPEALVPPGDCIIVEFGPQLAETTNRICESYVANNKEYD